MSIPEQEFIDELNESGFQDWIRGQITEGVGRTPPEPQPEAESTPQEESQPRDPETGRFVAQAEEEAPEAEPAPEGEENEAEEEPEAVEEDEEAEDEGFALELDEELEEFLRKNDGDLTKALKKAMWLESVTGRQGSELGELRAQLQELSQRLPSLAPYQTRIPDPDEAEPDEMASAFATLAYEALERLDAGTMGHAIEGWKEYDPFGAAVFVNQLQTQAALSQVQQQPVDTGASLEQEMTKLQERHPDIREYVDKIGELAQQRPTLLALMENGTPTEKAQAFEDLYLVIKSRETSEHSAKALKRVAVKASEEARKARAEARVVQSERVVTEPVKQEPDDRLIPLGKTGLTVSLNRVEEEFARLSGGGFEK